MHAHTIRSATRTPAFLLCAVIALAGCRSSAPATDDASLNTQVQQQLASDPNLKAQNINASVAGGVVTLTGNVTSETTRTIASGDVAQVPGVKTVVDNLLVQPAPITAAATPQPPAPASTPAPAQKSAKPSPMVAAHTPPQQMPPPAAAPIVRNETAPQPAPAPAVAQAPLPPPPAPAFHSITLPPGTDLPVRITQTLDSATTLTGDKFTGEIASDIIEDGMVVLAQGTPVTGHVDAAQDAKHYKGSSLLTISLTAINRHGEHVEVATEPYTRQGEGRGKNTAEKVGGGAAVGAILGGLIGHGAGAAIGAAAGAGAGAGANTITRGQQVQIESETVVRFKLSDPVLLHMNSGGGSPQSPGPALEHHNNNQ